jgi:hypothetical protein
VLDPSAAPRAAWSETITVLRRIREAVLAVCAASALALPSAAAADDGGAATYIARGATYDFALTNTGTTTWQSFSLTAPSGSVFVGGTTSNEGSAHCVVGPPATIVCGPVATGLLAARGRVGFTGVLEAPVACGAPFALAVSATGAQPFTPVGNAVFVGSCAPPRVVRPPVVRRAGGLVTLSPPLWSTDPERVAYQWQRCTRAACVAIRDATGERVRARAPVRAVVTAVFPDGTVLHSVTRKV